MANLRERVAGLFDSPRFYRALCLLVFATLIWNSRSYEAGDGFDFGGQRDYVDFVYENKALPDNLNLTQVAYNPPVFYLAAAGIKRVAILLDTNDRKLTKLILGLMACATAWMGAQIAGWILGPRGRPAFLLSLGSMTTYFKSAAMYSPEIFNASLIWLGLFAALRSWKRRGEIRAGAALSSGVATGLAILTRPLSLAMAPAWFLSLLLPLARARGRRLAWLAPFLILTGVTAIGAITYLKLNHDRWGHWMKGPAKGRPPGRWRYELLLPVEEWKSPHFYYGLALKPLFTAPMRQNFGRRLLPTLYSEWWGDYWKYWTLNARGKSINEPLRLRLLAAQNAAALIPTAMIAIGFFVLLFSSIRARPDNPAALFGPVGAMTAIAVAMFVYFVAHTTTRTLDPVKPHYLCFLVPAAALGGARALTWALNRPRGFRFGLVLYSLLFFCWSHFLFCLYLRP